MNPRRARAPRRVSKPSATALRSTGTEIISLAHRLPTLDASERNASIVAATRRLLPVDCVVLWSLHANAVWQRGQGETCKCAAEFVSSLLEATYAAPSGRWRVGIVDGDTWHFLKTGTDSILACCLRLLPKAHLRETLDPPIAWTSLAHLGWVSCAESEREQDRVTRLRLVRRGHRMRKRVHAVEQDSLFISKLSQRLGGCVTTQEIVDVALDMSTPRLGIATQVDLLVPQGQVHRRGYNFLKRETTRSSFEIHDPRFALQGRVLGRMRPTWRPGKKGRFVLFVWPLSARGQAIGVFTFFCRPNASSADKERAYLLQLQNRFTNRIAIALDQAALHEHLEETIRVRSDFLSLASHELCTPLMALSILLEHLLRRLHRPQQVPEELITRKVKDALTCTERLTGLVENMVEIGHLRSRSFHLRRIPCELTSLCHAVIAKERESASGAATPLFFSSEPKQIFVRIDPSRVKGIIRQLIANAVKYGQGLPVSVRVTQRAQKINVTVTDQGIGICETQHERIFGQYERAQSLRHYGGFGLGLYIAREVAQAHGGTLTVKSQLGQGSHFCLSLPGAAT